MITSNVHRTSMALSWASWSSMDEPLGPLTTALTSPSLEEIQLSTPYRVSEHHQQRYMTHSSLVGPEQTQRLVILLLLDLSIELLLAYRKVALQRLPLGSNALS